MVRTTSLERLYELDKAFAMQLDRLLHDGRFISQLMGLQEDELIQIVGYLNDTIRRLIYVGQSPRKCLHILHQISSTRKVLPPDYEVSGTLSPPGNSPSAYGGSSEVHQGILSIPKENVCIKRFRIHRVGDREKINQLLREEAILWKYLNHPNIVPFKGVILEPPQLVSEWMPGGELREHVKKSPSANLINLLLGVANGLEYLHSHGVIHGDLKGPNILIDASGNARITDFGLASIVRDPNSVRSGAEDYGYTPRWTAPEMFEDNPTSSKESDVFSFAMVAIEVFSGEVPFHGSRSNMVPGMIMSGARPDRPTHPSLTEPLWTLIQKCWKGAARDRPVIGDVIKELKGMKYIQPSKRLTEEPHAPIPGPSHVVGYDTGAPLPGPPHTPKVKGKGPLVPKETKVIGGGFANKPVSRPPPNIVDDLPTNDPGAGDEEEHEDRVPPKEDKDRKELGHRQSRKDLERERKFERAEVTAKDERKLGPSGSTTALPLQTNAPLPSRSTTPGTTGKPEPRIPLTVGSNDPPASDVGGGREHRPPPTPGKEDEDRKGLGRKKSRKDAERGRKPDCAEEGAKVTPEERPPNRSGSTTTVDPGINVITPSHPLAPELPSLRDNDQAIPPVTSACPRVNVEQPSHPLTFPPNLGGESTAMEGNQSRGQSEPRAVRYNPNPIGQIENHPKPDDRQGPLQPQTPTTNPPIIYETPEEVPKAQCWEFWSKEWWKCNCTCC